MSAYTRIAMVTAPLFVGLAIVGAATSGDAEAGAAPPASGPLSCEIQKTVRGSMVQLLGVVHADAPVSGSYMFSVMSSGGGNSSNINQGGPFMAEAKKPLTLGTVMLNTGSNYKATLTVTADGQTVACSDPAVI